MSCRMDTIRGTSGWPGWVEYPGPWLIAWWVPMRTDEAASCYTSHSFPAELIFFHPNMDSNILKSNCGLLGVLLGKWAGPWGYISSAKSSLYLEFLAHVQGLELQR